MIYPRLTHSPDLRQVVYNAGENLG